MNHPQFNDVLRWVADGHTVQASSPPSQKGPKAWYDQDVRGMLVSLANDGASHSVKYRKKPIMVQLGFRSFPLPLQEEPKAGTRVFLARPGLSPSEVAWTNTEGMRQALKDNLLHLDAESAQMHVDAMTHVNNEAVSIAAKRVKA